MRTQASLILILLQHSLAPTDGLYANLNWRVTVLETDYSNRLENLEQQLNSLHIGSRLPASNRDAEHAANLTEALEGIVVPDNLCPESTIDAVLLTSPQSSTHALAESGGAVLQTLANATSNVASAGAEVEDRSSFTFFSESAPAELTGTLLRLVEGHGSSLAVDGDPSGRALFPQTISRGPVLLLPDHFYCLPPRSTGEHLLDVFENQTLDLFVRGQV